MRERERERVCVARVRLGGEGREEERRVGWGDERRGDPNGVDFINSWGVYI